MKEDNIQTTAAAAAPPRAARSLHWPWFLLALLLPPVLTFAAAMAGWGNIAEMCPLFGGGLAGAVCGILLGRRVGKTPGAVAGLSILFVICFGFLSLFLCFGGCLAGGYSLNLH